MTLLIGTYLTHYTIIAADTRTSWNHPILGKYHKDGDHKIVMCSFGLVTGSGYVDALESVKKELLTREILHTNDVLQIINQKALPKIENLHKYTPGIKDNTCFLVSYRTAIDGEVILRLSLLHPNWEYQLAYYENPIVVMPTDSSEEEAEQYSKSLKNVLISLDEKRLLAEDYAKDILTNLYENINLISGYFYEISSHKSRYVSRDLDFAALMLDGTVIYGYGNSDEVMKGEFKMCVIPYCNKTRILAPDIFAEGKTIYIE
jgi:hypothetical protein